MEILGLSPIIASIVIAGLGVGINNVVGWLKSNDSFQPRKTAASAIVAFTIGIATVATALQNIEAVSQFAQFIIVINQIGAIAGIDFFTKKGFKAAKKD